jgi:hypothetical protein
MRTVIVDTTSSLAAGSEDKGFFKTQAHSNIDRGIQLLRLLNLTPTTEIKPPEPKSTADLLRFVAHRSRQKANFHYAAVLKSW